MLLYCEMIIIDSGMLLLYYLKLLIDISYEERKERI